MFRPQPRPTLFPYTTLFRSQGSTADTTLSSMATAGGKPRNGTPPYYPVAVGADLVAALKAIGTQVVSCSFTIPPPPRSEEHTSELQSHSDLVCRLLLEKKKK